MSNKHAEHSYAAVTTRFRWKRSTALDDVIASIQRNARCATCIVNRKAFRRVVERTGTAGIDDATESSVSGGQSGSNTVTRPKVGTMRRRHVSFARCLAAVKCPYEPTAIPGSERNCDDFSYGPRLQSRSTSCHSANGASAMASAANTVAHVHALAQSNVPSLADSA